MKTIFIGRVNNKPMFNGHLCMVFYSDEDAFAFQEEICVHDGNRIDLESGKYYWEEYE